MALDFPMPDSAVIQRKILDRQPVGTYQTIARYVLQNAELKIVEDVAHGMLMQLVSEVLKERVVGETQTVHLYVPASWWQHFKETYKDSRLFGWFVRKHPVVKTKLEKTVTFQRYFTYPNADVPKQVTPLGRPIIYETVSQSDWS